MDATLTHHTTHPPHDRDAAAHAAVVEDLLAWLRACEEPESLHPLLVARCMAARHGLSGEAALVVCLQDAAAGFSRRHDPAHPG